ncbi:MAG TPA: hypothetical protein PKA27_08160 [Fimbriimonadaceae bacterium]|nr:hypothetical protein [Fimbriimonadaceae bacterium]
MRHIIISAVLIVLCGCGSTKSKLIGTWKGVQVPQSGSPNFRDAAAGAMGNLVASGSTLEFNKDGRFKWSMVMGAGQGTYKVAGKEVTLNFESLAPTQPITFVLADDGKTLSTKKDFGSDATITFEKQ